MNYEITLEAVPAITLAVVRAIVPAGGIAAAWRPALDKVWAFLRSNQVANAGLNVFVYHHPERPGEAMHVDFGVQVLSRFDGAGEVRCIATPSGKVAQAVHMGPYDRLGDAHAAIHQWCQANNRPIAAVSWEIYGHWNNDPEKLETSVRYLLA